MKLTIPDLEFEKILKFITTDPARDGNNWYAYVNNNPLRYVDPTGLTVYDDVKQAQSGTYKNNDPVREKREVVPTLSNPNAGITIHGGGDLTVEKGLYITDKANDILGSQKKTGDALTQLGEGSIRAGNDLRNASSEVRAVVSIQGPGNVDPNNLFKNGNQIINEGDKLKNLSAPLKSFAKVAGPLAIALDTFDLGKSIYDGVVKSDAWIPVRSGVKIGAEYLGGAVGGLIGFYAGAFVGFGGTSPVTAPIGAGLGAVGGSWLASGIVQDIYDKNNWK